MKVHVLHYQYYENSEIMGVYTEDAMRRELAEHAERGRVRNEKVIADQERRLEDLKNRRKKLGQRDREIQEQQAQLKADNVKADSALRSERKKIMKEMSQLAVTIQNQEDGLEKMKNLTDKELAEREMRSGHLYFEEFYVMGVE